MNNTKNTNKINKTAQSTAATSATAAPAPNKHRISDIVSIVLFLAILFGFAVTFVVMPDASRNSFETGLQTFPNANNRENTYKGADYVLHGEMADDMDEYFCDQFPLRKAFVTLKALAETISYRGINNGVLNAGDYLVDVRFDSVGVGANTEYYSKDHVQSSLESLKTALDGLSVPADVILPPRKIDVVGPVIGYPTYIGDMLNEQAIDILGDYYVDVRPVFYERWDTEMVQTYYATDHHWNCVGAYYAFETWANRWLDVELNYESYEFFTVKYDFLGTSGRNGNYFTHPGDNMYVINFDKMDQLTLKTGSNLNAMKKQVGIYDMEALSSSDPYNVYLYGKSAYSTITNENEERETVLIIKDSFAHNFAPFLARYCDVVMVDLDMYGGSNPNAVMELNSLVEKTGADRVLVLYNMQNVIETEKLDMIQTKDINKQ